jgi:hypothetical protein
MKKPADQPLNLPLIIKTIYHSLSLSFSLHPLPLSFLFSHSPSFLPSLFTLSLLPFFSLPSPPFISLLTLSLFPFFSSPSPPFLFSFHALPLPFSLFTFSLFIVFSFTLSFFLFLFSPPPSCLPFLSLSSPSFIFSPGTFSHCPLILILYSSYPFALPFLFHRFPFKYRPPFCLYLLMSLLNLIPLKIPSLLNLRITFPLFLSSVLHSLSLSLLVQSVKSIGTSFSFLNSCFHLFHIPISVLSSSLFYFTASNHSFFLLSSVLLSLLCLFHSVLHIAFFILHCKKG